jgi:hypothetical protein
LVDLQFRAAFGHFLEHPAGKLPRGRAGIFARQLQPRRLLRRQRAYRHARGGNRMSITGRYVRVAAGDLEWLNRDPEAFMEASMASMTPGWENDPSTQPWISIEKAWAALGYLLAKATDGTIDVVFGGTPIGEDWGFGPPRYVAPDEIRQAADMLSRTPFDRLAAHYDARQLRDAKIYPGVWDEDDLRGLEIDYETLVEFFAVAAKSGDGMVLALM